MKIYITFSKNHRSKYDNNGTRIKRKQSVVRFFANAMTHSHSFKGQVADSHFIKILADRLIMKLRPVYRCVFVDSNKLIKTLSTYDAAVKRRANAVLWPIRPLKKNALNIRWKVNYGNLVFFIAFGNPTRRPSASFCSAVIIDYDEIASGACLLEYRCAPILYTRHFE